MKTFSSLAVALFAIGSLASPVAVEELSPAVVEERGEPDFILGEHNAVRRRQATDYTQDYTTGGGVTFSTSGNSFSVSYNTNNDFVVGRGWRTGTAR